MQNRNLTIGLSVALMLASLGSIFLGYRWHQTEKDIQAGVEAIGNLNQINQDLNTDISNLETDLASLQDNTQSLELELAQLSDDRDALQTKVDLYQSQKAYLTDVLDWYNQNYFFQPADALINNYIAATGNTEP